MKVSSRSLIRTRLARCLVPEVTLDEEAYHLLEAERRPDEDHSDVLHRLLGPGPPNGESWSEGMRGGSGGSMEDVSETAGDEDAELEG